MVETAIHPYGVTLQDYLVEKFQEWQPQAPTVLERTKRSVTLRWLEAEPFGFMENHLLYHVQRREKIPPWVIVYSGGKTTKTIDNLAPSHPHKFRLQVILKSSAVSILAEAAIKHHGDKNTIYEVMENIRKVDENVLEEKSGNIPREETQVSETPTKLADKEEQETTIDDISNEVPIKNSAENAVEEAKDTTSKAKEYCTSLDNTDKRSKTRNPAPRCLQSRWSAETWSSTDTAGTTTACFCMAVRCGYFKQVQVMVEERPELIAAISPSSGLTALATAVRKGDLNAVKFVLSLGADVDQPTSSSQTPLHLGVLAGDTAIVDALLEKGADFQSRDFNGLRVEHYAVESCKLDMLRHVLDRGGDVTVKDCNGWTPLFRAVCQGAKTEIIEELLHRGSSVEVTDRRGLTLIATARLLRNRHGRPRDSVLRLVDSHFPHEKALANFTRLTKKIYSVHSLLK